MFKNSNLKYYWLCPSHYWSESALSWDTMINMIINVLELTSEADIHLFFEKCMKSGVLYI